MNVLDPGRGHAIDLAMRPSAFIEIARVVPPRSP
jgi:hypothetical protein